MGCVKSYFKQAQSAGVSPSSTTDTANKGAGDSAVPSNDPSFLNVSSEKLPEEPESVDTSYGVEATAVRKLAASTGTVAILGTTAQTASKDQLGNEGDDSAESAKETEENSFISNDETQRINDNSVDTIEMSATQEANGNPEPYKEHFASGNRIPLITETLVPDPELSPDEQSCELMVAVDPPRVADNDNPDVSSTVHSEGVKEAQTTTPKPVIVVDDTKSDSIETTSAKTAHNDISSEQMKTNSLSDISFSEFDDLITSDEPKEEAASNEISEEQPIGEVTSTPHQLVSTGAENETTGATNTIEEDSANNKEIIEPSESNDDDGQSLAATKIQSTFRGYLVRKTTEANRIVDDGDDKLTDSQIESLKDEVDEIIREAEETTESIRNTPDEGDAKNVEEFPDPPDDLTLNELINNDQSQSLLPSSSSGNSSANLTSNGDEISEQKDLTPLNNESTSSDMEKLTADEDLPAPDTELLESSYTEDLNTEILNSVKVHDDDKSDAADLTIDEDSEVLKDVQKPQECDELNRSDIMVPSPDHNSAATLIQANIRGFLTRRQMDLNAGVQSGAIHPRENDAEETLPGDNAAPTLPTENAALSNEGLPVDEDNTAQAEGEKNETSADTAPVEVLGNENGSGSINGVNSEDSNSSPVSPQPEHIAENHLPHLRNVPRTLAELASEAVPRGNFNLENPGGDPPPDSHANGRRTANGTSHETEQVPGKMVNKPPESGHSNGLTRPNNLPIDFQSLNDLGKISVVEVSEAYFSESEEVKINVDDISESTEANDSNTHVNIEATITEDKISNDAPGKINETKSLNTEVSSENNQDISADGKGDEGQDGNSTENRSQNPIHESIQQTVKPNLPLEENENPQTHIRQLKTPEVFVSQYEGDGIEAVEEIPDFHDVQPNASNENETESASPIDNNTVPPTDVYAKEDSSPVNTKEKANIEMKPIESDSQNIGDDEKIDSGDEGISLREDIEKSTENPVTDTTKPSTNKSTTPTNNVNDSPPEPLNSGEEAKTDKAVDKGAPHSNGNAPKRAGDGDNTSSAAKKL